jgi:hypothetical protein
VFFVILGVIDFFEIFGFVWGIYCGLLEDGKWWDRVTLFRKKIVFS